MQRILLFIEKERTKQGFKKQSYCKEAGITVQYYAKILEGKSSPAYEIIEKMLQVLGYKLEPIVIY